MSKFIAVLIPNILNNVSQLSTSIRCHLAFSTFKPHHGNHITMTFRELHAIPNHWQLDCLFSLTQNDTLKLCLTGPLWRESNGNRYSSHKRPAMRKAFPCQGVIKHLAYLIASHYIDSLSLVSLLTLVGKFGNHRWCRCKALLKEIDLSRVMQGGRTLAGIRM